MSASILGQTMQAAILSATSNILAQVISSYRDDKPFAINLIPLLRFVFYSLLNTPPNILWQRFLEARYPTTTTTAKNPKPKPDADTSKELAQQRNASKPGTMNKTNVLKKFTLDQSIGALANTVMFIAVMTLLNGDANTTWRDVQTAVTQRVGPLFLNGMKIWPLFSIVSFTLIPVDRRIVAGSMLGVGWGIYLSMVAAGAGR